MSQPSLFDVPEGERRKRDGMDRAEEHAVPPWNNDVDLAILRAARRLDLFTTDDVWAELQGLPAWTHEPRAMGPAMRRACGFGWCKPTDAFWLSKRPDCHRRPLRVWESLYRAVVG